VTRIDVLVTDQSTRDEGRQMDTMAETGPVQTGAEGAAAAGAATDRTRWAALVTLCLGVLMIVLDTTVVNVALPAIQDDLGFSAASLAWVVNGYLIAFGGLLLLAGRLGDLVGPRTVYLAGLVVFTAASVACGTAQSQAVLVGARFVQGAAGALTTAVILAMIVRIFPEPREQAKAIGVYAFVASGGGAVGLLAGGVLTESVNWHWIFFVNVPIGLVTLAATVRLIPHQPGIGLGAGADYLGAGLVTGGLMVAVYTIVEPAASRGWSDPLTVSLGISSVALLAAFVVRQARATHALMPLRVLRSRNVVGANVVQVAGAGAMFSVFFMGALYMERVLGYGPLAIGLAFLPVAGLMAVVSVRYSDRLAAAIGPRRSVMLGSVLMGSGLVLLTRAPVHGTYAVDLLPSMALLGAGAGTCFPALMGLAMVDAAPEDAGLASGLVNTTAQVGGALGLAVLATATAARTTSLLGDGVAAPEAMTAGFRVAFAAGTVLMVVALLVAATVLREAAPAEATVGAEEQTSPEDARPEAHCPEPAGETA
jgi:EmrB/QacA subfamily drug resistance transporter